MKPDYPPARGLLNGRTVVITAAAGAGIGFSAAKRCVEEGARVVISDIHEKRLATAAAALSALAGETVPGIRCNVTVQEDIDNLMAAAIVDSLELYCVTIQLRTGMVRTRLCTQRRQVC